MFDWTLGIIEAGGYWGIFLLMVLENVFPPIPSELIIPLSGYAAAQGDMNIVLVILVASLGAVAGALPWYFLGRLFGIKRLKYLSNKFGRWITLNSEDIDLAKGWFDKHGFKAVLFGRLIPTVRTLISVPAGLVKMSVPKFLFFSFIGSSIWTAILALAGYWLGGQHEAVSVYLDPLSNFVVVAIVVIYIYRVVTFKKSS